MLSPAMYVDPGVEAAWAVWFRAELKPRHVRMVKPHKGSWEERVDELMYDFNDDLRAWAPRIVVIEWPKLFESGGGMVSARSGALLKLMYVVGRMVEAARSKRMAIKLVDVNDWKGQMSKTAVKHRVRKRLGSVCDKLKLKEHMWDAVGIGLSHRREF
jgi:hypothetical protein